MEILIRKQGGDAFVAPSLREAPIEAGEETLRFAERLLASGFDMLMLLTGVGTRQLARWFSSRYGAAAFPEALGRLTVAARGTKTTAALRELGIAPAIVAPEPNTWRELLSATEGRPERRVAVQEYGRSNPELLSALRARGCETTAVRVYEYALPEDTAPLREAARRLAAGEFDIVLFTTAVQIAHLMQVAEGEKTAPATLAGLRRAAIASIGPTTTEALEEFGLHPALEPSHPRMGLLVLETAEKAAGLARSRLK